MWVRIQGQIIFLGASSRSVMRDENWVYLGESCVAMASEEQAQDVLNLLWHLLARGAHSADIYVANDGGIRCVEQ